MATGKTTRRILSLDGGGIRGLVPALVLEHIERKMDKPIAEMFDLIVGTSTGGILALGLTVPDASGEKPRFAGRDLRELYERRGAEIFHRTTWHRIKSGWGYADEKYPSEPIESILLEYFGDTSLSQALCEVMVTAYALERRAPFFFRSRRARDTRRYGDAYNFLMRQAARATSAAPTYFEPFKLPSRDDQADYYALVDGGVFANNPAMCAYAEARRYWKNDSIVLVSLGTGELIRRLPYDQARDWGLAQWVKPLLDVVFDGVSDSVNFQVAQLLGSKHMRIQARLDASNDDMDDASQTNIRALKLLGEDLIKNERKALNTICEALT
jgi:patatin-like phospholipase/acyl hydrolase